MAMYDMENLQQVVMHHPQLSNMFQVLPIQQPLPDPLPERKSSISTQTNAKKKKPKVDKAENSQVIQIQLVDSNMKQLRSPSKVSIKGGTKESRSLVQSSLTNALEMALNTMTQTQHKSQSKGHKVNRSMSKVSTFSKTSKLSKFSSKKPKETKKRAKSIGMKMKVRKDTMAQEVEPIYQASHSIDNSQFKVLIYKEPNQKAQKPVKSR